MSIKVDRIIASGDARPIPPQDESAEHSAKVCRAYGLIEERLAQIRALGELASLARYSFDQVAETTWTELGYLIGELAQQAAVPAGELASLARGAR
jgi:hypothetical protein